MTVASARTGRSARARIAAAHAIRRMQVGGIPIIDSDMAKRLMDLSDLPTPMEQVDLLVQWMGANHHPGGAVSRDSVMLQGVLGAVGDDGVRYVIDSAKALGLVEAENRLNGGWLLTLPGWQHYEELRRGTATSRTAFMAMKFGDPQLDAFVDAHMRPAVAATGFTLRRLDDVPRAGLIDDRMRVDIRNARFLIADLTHGNNGAYWEAGFAEGLGKPVIYTCRKDVFDDPGSRPHFDTNHHLTVLWAPGDEADAMARLKATIRATILDARQED